MPLFSAPIQCPLRTLLKEMPEIKGKIVMGATGLEPVTPSVSYTGHSLENAEKQGNSDSPESGLHAGLHKNQECTPSATVQALAALLSNLTEADRAALASLLGTGRAAESSS